MLNKTVTSWLCMQMACSFGCVLRAGVCQMSGLRQRLLEVGQQCRSEQCVCFCGSSGVCVGVRVCGLVCKTVCHDMDLIPRPYIVLWRLALFCFSQVNMLALNTMLLFIYVYLTTASFPKKDLYTPILIYTHTYRCDHLTKAEICLCIRIKNYANFVGPAGHSD